MLPELTEKQRRLLAYLEDWVARAGRTPSLREAAEELGVSHAAVRQLLGALEEKGYLRREGRYSRVVRLLNPLGETAAFGRGREVPLVGRIAAGLPLYAQQEWDGTVVVDAEVFRGQGLFALRVQGETMVEAGILDGDVVICRPQQFAQDGEIVVALINGEEATVKRFYLHPDRVELRPANARLEPMFFSFDQVLVQGKVVGLFRGPERISRL
jgi:repressor LexA